MASTHPDCTVETNFGISRSGKTFALMRRVEHTEKRCLVLDRLREWVAPNGEPAIDADTGLVTEIGQLRDALESNARVIVVQPERRRFDPSGDEKRGRDPLIDIACRMADECLDNGMILVTPEAHRIAGNNGALPTSLDELAGAYRHWDAGWFGDSQRPALLSPRMREQCETVRIFGIAGIVDKRTIADNYGIEALAAVEEAARRLKAGEPGWHVHIDPRYVIPPYPLSRFVKTKNGWGLETEHPRSNTWGKQGNLALS